MAKRQKSSKTANDEQLDLIDVKPKNSKEIIKAARGYKAAQAKRISAQEQEVAEKQNLLELVKKENLQPLEDGKIQFRCDGLIITITPRDELIRVKEDGD